MSLLSRGKGVWESHSQSLKILGVLLNLKLMFERGKCVPVILTVKKRVFGAQVCIFYKKNQYQCV